MPLPEQSSMNCSGSVPWSAGRRENSPARKIVRPEEREVEKIGILGTDVSDLISTIDHNIRLRIRRFSTEGLLRQSPSEALPGLKKITGKGQALLEYMDRQLSRKDRDLNPQAAGPEGSARESIYYFEDDYSGGPKE
jgi:hypothetical protein